MGGSAWATEAGARIVSVTTPDTADVRRWAIENGITVASRGRLPAEIHRAYLAAQAGGSPASGTKKAATAAKESRPDTAATSTGKPAATARPAQSQPTSRTESAQRSQPTSRLEPAAAASRPDRMDDVEQTSPARAAEPNAHISALQQQVADLVERVSSLEKSASSAGSSAGPESKPGSESKPSLFRRRKG